MQAQVGHLFFKIFPKFSLLSSLEKPARADSATRSPLVSQLPPPREAWSPGARAACGPLRELRSLTSAKRFAEKQSPSFESKKRQVVNWPRCERAIKSPWRAS